jgi:hypothetical protein
MCRNNIRLIIVLFNVLFFTHAMSVDRHVGNGQTYSTISAAISAAGSGDNVIVHSGTYAEMLDISKSNVTVQNFQNDLVTVTGGNNSRVVRILGGSNFTFRGIRFAASSSPQWIVAMGGGSSTNTTFDACTFIGGSGTDKWIYQDNSNSYNGLTITHCDFSGRSTYDGPFYLSSSNRLTFSYNNIDAGGLASGAGTVFFAEFMNEEAGSNYCYVENNYWYNIGSQISVAAFMFRECDGFYFRNNVISVDADYNNASYDYLAQIRGMTNGGDACDNFYFECNTIITGGSQISNGGIVFFSDTPVNNKITNNLIIGNVGTFANTLSPFNTGSGNVVQNNRCTDASVTWSASMGGGFTVSNNSAGQSVIWNASGNIPSPYYDLTGSSDGGVYVWNPSIDYDGNPRHSPPDIGAFEYGTGTINNPPGKPTGMSVNP